MACIDHCAHSEDKHCTSADHHCIIREIGESIEPSFQVYFLLKPIKTFHVIFGVCDSILQLLLHRHLSKYFSFFQGDLHYAWYIPTRQPIFDEIEPRWRRVTKSKVHLHHSFKKLVNMIDNIFRTTMFCDISAMLFIDMNGLSFKETNRLYIVNITDS